ncbi:hypothetical protein PAMP_008462 [Pampus punctatissimus]
MRIKARLTEQRARGQRTEDRGGVGSSAGVCAVQHREEEEEEEEGGGRLTVTQLLPTR